MITGAGFAMMAWRLAQLRTYGHVGTNAYPPFPRAVCTPGRKPASTEYYRIIDAAEFWTRWRTEAYGKAGRIYL